MGPEACSIAAAAADTLVGDAVHSVGLGAVDPRVDCTGVSWADLQLAGTATALRWCVESGADRLAVDSGPIEVGGLAWSSGAGTRPASGSLVVLAA